ncbi:hypothetical protein L1987_58009 [Smallanthus sonchifolius]|uniref:Uncharacterized protein n=1 Tax=Smallanthus sonchifolius TaxID=185202 RepID=A0ACB9DF70_9ASTR|nr:hypothetical protein L1987_58009 [Smallanthus sonchifolius]
MVRSMSLVSDNLLLVASYEAEMVADWQPFPPTTNANALPWWMTNAASSSDQERVVSAPSLAGPPNQG